MSFEDNIKNWVSLDNKIKQLNDELRGLRENRNNLTGELITYATDNDLTHKIIEITDGNLKFQNQKITSPLTFKFITECLTDCISDEDQVKQLVNYIKEKRGVKYVGELKRSYKS